MIINLILLTCIIVYIIDISGIIDTIKSCISKWMSKGKIDTTDFRMRPFDCSLCMTFWSGVIYILCMNEFTIPYLALVCLLSFGTNIIRALYLLINDLTAKIFSFIYDHIK